MSKDLNVLFENGINDFKNWIDGAKLLGISLNSRGALSHSPAISLAETFKTFFEEWKKEYKKNKSLLKSLLKKSDAEKCYKAILKSLEEIDKLNNKGNQKAMISCIKSSIAGSNQIPDMIKERKDKLVRTLSKWENSKLTSDKTKGSPSIKEFIKKLRDNGNDPSTEYIIELNGRD